jgi:hypothetical protein
MNKMFTVWASLAALIVAAPIGKAHATDSPKFADILDSNFESAKGRADFRVTHSCPNDGRCQTDASAKRPDNTGRDIFIQYDGEAQRIWCFEKTEGVNTHSRRCQTTDDSAPNGQRAWIEAYFPLTQLWSLIPSDPLDPVCRGRNLSQHDIDDAYVDCVVENKEAPARAKMEVEAKERAAADAAAAVAEKARIDAKAKADAEAAAVEVAAAKAKAGPKQRRRPTPTLRLRRTPKPRRRRSRPTPRPRSKPSALKSRPRRRPRCRRRSKRTCAPRPRLTPSPRHRPRRRRFPMRARQPTHRWRRLALAPPPLPMSSALSTTRREASLATRSTAGSTAERCLRWASPRTVRSSSPPVRSSRSGPPSATMAASSCAPPATWAG